MTEQKNYNQFGVRIVLLKPMRMLTSFIKNSNRKESEKDDCLFYSEWRRITGGGLKLYPGEGFETYTSICEGMQCMRKIPDDCVNDTIYEDLILDGFFAVAATQPDCFVDVIWDAINKWIINSEYYELDAISTGGSRSELYGTGFDSVSTVAGELIKIDGDVTVKEDFIKAFSEVAYPNQWECYVPIRKKLEK